MKNEFFIGWQSSGQTQLMINKRILDPCPINYISLVLLDYSDYRG